MATQYIDPTADGGRGFTYTQNGAGTYDVTDSFGRPLDQGVKLPANLKPGAVQTTPTTNTYIDAQGVSHAPTAPGASPGNPSADVVPTATHRDASGNLIYTGADGLKHDQNGNTYNNGTITPKVEPPQPATTQPTTQTQQPVQQPQQTQNQAPAAAPTAGWAPGHTGAEVKVLQDMLVSKGFMTAAQVATGPGVFGPKTQAALAAYQLQNGTVNGGSPTTSPTAASGGASYTNQPTTPTQPAKSAVQSVIDDYTTAYTSLGLGDIKSEYQKFVQQQTDLTNKQNEEKQNIDNNPWMSQGVKDRTKAQIDTKYQGQQDTLTHQISLLDSLYKQGQMEVNNIVSKAEAIDAAQAKEASDLAQKQIDAATELRKETKQDSQFQQTLAIQQQNADTSRISATKAPAGTKQTVSERQQEALGVYASVIAPGKKLPDGTPVTDSNGYITPTAWKALVNDYQGPRADFIKQYGNNIYTQTAKDGTVTVPSSYGLTPAEVKLIT